MPEPPPRERSTRAGLLPRFSLRELCLLVIAVAVTAGWYVQYQRNHPERPPTLGFADEFLLSSISDFTLPTDDSPKAFRHLSGAGSGREMQADAEIDWEDPALDGRMLDSIRHQCLAELERRECKIHVDGSESLASFGEGFAIHYSSRYWRGYASVHFVRLNGETGHAFFRVEETLRSP